MRTLTLRYVMDYEVIQSESLVLHHGRVSHWSCCPRLGLGNLTILVTIGNFPWILGTKTLAMEELDDFLAVPPGKFTYINLECHAHFCKRRVLW